MIHNPAAGATKGYYRIQANRYVYLINLNKKKLKTKTWK